ncbi:Heterogeneous nuclear ribonucleoprotein U-like protein 1 [Varanus komodoensis]|nr:Heterogeneous nuclear ribonucleoprotein U-like protein 1 [Varanus komodoensis]
MQLKNCLYEILALKRQEKYENKPLDMEPYPKIWEPNISYPMEKTVWLLVIMQYILPTSSGLKCDQVKKTSRAVLLTWSEFPKGGQPDFYVVTYHPKDDFVSKNVKSVSALQVEAQNATIFLEESKKYDVIVQSLKNGEVLYAKAFKTCKYSNVCLLLASLYIRFEKYLIEKNNTFIIDNHIVMNICMRPNAVSVPFLVIF